MTQRSGRAVNLLVPPACPLCHTPLQFDDGLCAACWGQLPFISGPVCQISGQPMPYDLGADTLSPAVLTRPPPYDQARAALAYDGLAARLIRRFKFHDRPEIARLLARLMAMAGADMLAAPSVLVPVPLHRRRLMARRFNQAAEIGRALERLSGHSLAVNQLIRTRATRRQIGLTRSGRLRNLRGAFAVRRSAKSGLRGRRVVLLDDVLTTGATAEACAKTLKQAGCAEVHVLTAARVVMGERLPISLSMDGADKEAR